MYEKPKKLFVRELLVTLLTFINIILLAILSNAGLAGLIISGILTLLNAFALLFFLVISVMNIFKHIKDKDDSNLGIHVINFLMALIMTVLFSFFYFVVVIALMIPLITIL